MIARNALLAVVLAGFAMTLPATSTAQQWHSDTGYTTYTLNALSPTSSNSWGSPAPVVETPCSSSPGAGWCLHVNRGWVRYAVTLSGPDGKGYDVVGVNARLDSIVGQGCGVAIARAGGSNPYQNWVAAADGSCADHPGPFPWSFNVGAFEDTPTHTAGSHNVWVWCHEYETSTCHMYVFNDIQVVGYYRTFTIDVRDVTQEAFGPSNLAPETCATFWIEGSPHHRNVEIGIDWGLGAGAVTTEQVDLGLDGHWDARRCQVLPLSVLDYNVCFRARETDGLRRELTNECRTVSGGLL